MSIFDLKHKNAPYYTAVTHTTFNLFGRGLVRIHLVPPKFKLFSNPKFLVILNGYYILPIGYSWAKLLYYFMTALNKYDGKQILQKDMDDIVAQTLQSMKKEFPSQNHDQFLTDLSFLIDTFSKIATNCPLDFDIEKLSIRKYAKYMTAPHRVDLMISSMTDVNGCWQCNERCRICYASGEKKSVDKELSTLEWKKIIDKLKTANVPMLTFTGGEPTMRQDLTELISYSKFFVTRLNTNGTLLTSELCKALALASLDSVQITLYSHDENVHNELVGFDNTESSGSYAKTIEGIKNAVSAGLDVSVNTPLTTLNKDYDKTLEFLNSLHVKFFTCSGVIMTGKGRANDLSLSENDLQKAVQSGVEVADKLSLELSFTSPGLLSESFLAKNKLQIPSCGACLSNMAISPSGDVLPCQSWLGGESLGNLLDCDFKSIWNAPLCKQLRKMTDKESLDCPFRHREQQL